MVVRTPTLSGTCLEYRLHFCLIMRRYGFADAHTSIVGTG